MGGEGSTVCKISRKRPQKEITPTLMSSPHKSFAQSEAKEPGGGELRNLKAARKWPAGFGRLHLPAGSNIAKGSVEAGATEGCIRPETVGPGRQDTEPVPGHRPTGPAKIRRESQEAGQRRRRRSLREERRWPFEVTEGDPEPPRSRGSPPERRASAFALKRRQPFLPTGASMETSVCVGGEGGAHACVFIITLLSNP